MLSNAKREVLLLRYCCYLSQVVNDFSIRVTLLSNTTGSSEGETEVCLHQHPFLSFHSQKGCAKPGKKRMFFEVINANAQVSGLRDAHQISQYTKLHASMKRYNFSRLSNFCYVFVL